MKIEFKPFSENHFPLMLKWLSAPHVKAWWDNHVNHTETSIKEKYSSYVNGYKLESGEKKAIHSYIIHVDNNPVGYIQIYNAYDFARSKPLVGLPKSLAAIDFFIGDADYIRKGISTEVLESFDYEGYQNILVGPDMNNIAAIRTYEKAGFKKIMEDSDINKIWMIASL